MRHYVSIHIEEWNREYRWYGGLTVNIWESCNYESPYDDNIGCFTIESPTFEAFQAASHEDANSVLGTESEKFNALSEKLGKKERR